MWCISLKTMVNSVRQKNAFYSRPFLKMRKPLLDMRKDFLIMSNFYLVEILSEPNSLTIVTSKKNTQNEQLCAHFVYFFPHNENQEFAVHLRQKCFKRLFLKFQSCPSSECKGGMVFQLVYAETSLEHCQTSMIKSSIIDVC